jgi:hypothetical protein
LDPVIAIRKSRAGAVGTRLALSYLPGTEPASATIVFARSSSMPLPLVAQ